MTIEAKPFLRWAGSKRTFVDTVAPMIRNYLSATEGAYYEPFLGGGSMALALPDLPVRILSDVVEELIITYAQVRDNPVELAQLLLSFAEFGTDEKAYYAIRDTDTDSTLLETAARCIYLNAHCFNGLYRTNREGRFNVPYGKKENRITDSLIERIGAASEALQLAQTACGDFEQFIARAGPGDFVYVDSPYDGTFSGYSEHGFCGTSQERLAQSLISLHQRGGTFLAHNADTETVRWWYGKWATIHTTKEKRAISSSGDRTKANCLMITNLPAAYIDHKPAESILSV